VQVKAARLRAWPRIKGHLGRTHEVNFAFHGYLSDEITMSAIYPLTLPRLSKDRPNWQRTCELRHLDGIKLISSANNK
jgi:hypothetical protein